MNNLSNLSIASESRQRSHFELPDKNSLRSVRGGRPQSLKTLTKLHKYVEYKTDREYPAKSGTTRLSAHNKFGTYSIREVYHSAADKLDAEHQLIVELFWRDFYSHSAFFFPRIFRGSFYPKYDALEWDATTQKFDAWRTGQTRFPIVDAGM